MLPLFAATVALSHVDASPVQVDGWTCHPTRLMVKAGQIPAQTLHSIGARVLARVPHIGWSVLEVRPGYLRASKKALEASHQVAKVQYDRAAKLAYTPNDPLWANQWHMRTIKADLAWDTNKGSTSTMVAIIDTGMLTSHPDLVGNVWTNAAEIPGNNVDDDNNGYVDDVHGYDFAYNDGNPEDLHGHGTACAGLVGAVQDNNLGVTGVCPNVRLMAIKATNDSGYLYDSYLAPAYVYSADMGARVFSMSYFSDRVSLVETDAMNYAVSRGVLPVAAAANESSTVPMFPAAYENVLAVAATDGNNNRSWFSNYGTWVDVAAPGEGLTTTAANGDYTGFGGTSGACPHVAGLAALLTGAKPTATAQEVRNAIEDTATLLNQPPFGEFSNYGLIDAQAALTAVLTTPAPPKPATVRYITIMGQSLSTTSIDPARFVTARIYGRGFQGLQNLQVKRAGVPAQILQVTRDWIDYKHVYRTAGDVSVWDGNTLIAAIPNPIVPRKCNPLVEAGEPSAWVDGGFRETVVDDGQFLVGHPDGNGDIILQGTFRKVGNNSNTQLRVNRTYAVGGGTESIQLYDWSSASYPYGSWITVWSGTAPASPTTTIVNVPDIARYIDIEGTTYVRFVKQGNPANELLKIDSLRLQDKL